MMDPGSGLSLNLKKDSCCWHIFNLHSINKPPLVLHCTAIAFGHIIGVGHDRHKGSCSDLPYPIATQALCVLTATPCLQGQALLFHSSQQCKSFQLNVCWSWWSCSQLLLLMEQLTCSSAKFGRLQICQLQCTVANGRKNNPKQQGKMMPIYPNVGNFQFHNLSHLAVCWCPYSIAYCYGNCLTGQAHLPWMFS